jgi:hypothetical protein
MMSKPEPSRSGSTSGILHREYARRALAATIGPCRGLWVSVLSCYMHAFSSTQLKAQALDRTNLCFAGQ